MAKFILKRKQFKSSTLITVRNAITGNSTVPDDTCLDYYFKIKNYHLSVMFCPSCHKLMFRKRVFPNTRDNNIMVGGHVELVFFPQFKYIIPICKECNDKKQNLRPFKVELDRLCRAPRE